MIDQPYQELTPFALKLRVFVRCQLNEAHRYIKRMLSDDYIRVGVASHLKKERIGRRGPIPQLIYTNVGKIIRDFGFNELPVEFDWERELRELERVWEGEGERDEG